MSGTQETRDNLSRLTDVVIELDHRVIGLESDIYDLKRENTELRRHISNLETKKRMPPL